VEWVETTGSTTAEAKDAALDQLGVDEQDAEFEVIEEAKSGLFGLTRREARVRARVRPTSPRPKAERRDRRKKQATTGSRRSSTSTGTRLGRAATAPASVDADADADAEDIGDIGDIGAENSEAPSKEPATRSRRAPANSRRAPKSKTVPSPESGDNQQEGKPMTSDDATVEEQAEIIAEFVGGLVEAYGLVGEVTQEQIDEETIELQVDGDDLGLLIGPKGQTLSAIQELSRTVVQRRASGTHHGRVRLDVSGYRQRRREALARFAGQVADDVKTSGVQKALEPMNAADRKVVHDTINEIDGVRTVSEGEDQRRRVVILPDD
jgi:spoIIIJ-associated protein